MLYAGIREDDLPNQVLALELENGKVLWEEEGEYFYLHNYNFSNALIMLKNVKAIAKARLQYYGEILSMERAL